MRVPAVSIVGWSGAGKTTLLERLVGELRARGLRVGVVKHSTHEHALHQAGSDTERLEQAGAAFTALATPSGVQLTVPGGDTELLGLLELMGSTVDVVLVEGWKTGPLPKVEVWREGLGPLLANTQGDVRAVVSEQPVPVPVRRFAPEELPALASFVLECGRE
jgi:molybdopterin-guanine dinucleotide biosynthesis adapter protein